jgi:hypothetical protein
MCHTVLSRKAMTCIMILAKGEWRFVRFGWLFDKRGIAIVSMENETAWCRRFASPFAQSSLQDFWSSASDTERRAMPVLIKGFWRRRLLQPRGPNVVIFPEARCQNDPRGTRANDDIFRTPFRCSDLCCLDFAVPSPSVRFVPIVVAVSCRRASSRRHARRA